MSATIALDPMSEAAVVASLDHVAVKIGVPIKYLCVDQMRLLLNDLVKFLPPVSKKAGDSAVGYDISRIIQPMTDNEIDFVRTMNPKAAQLQGARIFTAKSGAVYLIDQAYYEPNASDSRIHDFHQSQRISSGRVTSAGSRTRDIGRWKAVDTLHVRESTYRSYVASVKKRVGTLKAGFAGALRAAAAFTGGRAIIPSWVKKAESANSGYHDFSGMDDRGNGAVRAVNLAPYAARKASSFLPSLMAKRALDVARAWRSEKRAQQIVDQFNRGQA
jgi:hypothetical protein